MLLLPLGLYDLVSEVIHYGQTSESGHYVAIIHEKDELIKISDAVVKRIGRLVFPWTNNDSNKCYYVGYSNVSFLF